MQKKQVLDATFRLILINKDQNVAFSFFRQCNRMQINKNPFAGNRNPSYHRIKLICQVFTKILHCDFQKRLHYHRITLYTITQMKCFYHCISCLFPIHQVTKNGKQRSNRCKNRGMFWLYTIKSYVQSDKKISNKSAVNRKIHKC